MRRTISIALCLILLVTLAVSASAAATRAFLLQEYDVSSGEVLCYGKQLPAGGTLEISAGSQLVKNAVFSTLEKEQIPVTVYCLVDSATSLPDSAAQQREDFLLNISSLMGAEDSMVLATIDSVLTESKSLTSKDVRDVAIKTISGQNWATNLYDGISQAVKTLHTNPSYNTNRCLIIISDGHDDGKSSATPDTILKQIQEAGIPVYSVILRGSITEKELDQQEEFTKESLGGYLSYPSDEGISASAAAQQVWSSIKGSTVIRIDTDELPNNGTDQELLIRYTSADTLYEDTILIRAVDLPIPETQPSTEVTETEATDETGEATTGDEEEDEEEGLPVKLLVIGGVAVLLLAGGVAAFFILRKKPQQVFEVPTSAIPQELLEMDTPVDISFSNEADTFQQTTPVATDSMVTMPVDGRCHVSAVAIMHPEIQVDFYLTRNMETTFGRTEKADVVLNETDKKLSGCHGAFFWNGEMLLVQDRKSTNGTAVNGEVCPKDVWLRLENGAILTAGRYEYRITFKADA